MAGMVRYQVMKKAFVNNTLYDPAMASQPIYVMGPPDLDSDALKRADDAGKAPDPGQTAGPVPGAAPLPAAVPATQPIATVDAATEQRIADLEALVKSGEDAVGTLQSLLNDERAKTERLTAEVAAANDRAADAQRKLDEAGRAIEALNDDLDKATAATGKAKK